MDKSTKTSAYVELDSVIILASLPEKHTLAQGLAGEE